MSRIAIDIVLLPDEAFTDFVIAANALLVKKFHSEIVLAQNGCLPHISLAMGCLDSEKIPSLARVLEPFVKTASKHLKSVGFSKSLNSAGQTISSVQIERSAELQNLHEKICNAVKSFFTFDVIPEMLAGSRAAASTLQWISSYFVKSGYENFSPHITVGFGDLETTDFTACPERSRRGYSACRLPTDFAVSRLAVCHLADHCTCAKILWSADI